MSWPGSWRSMVPVVVAALFGSSWHLISGPTTTASLVIYANVSLLAAPGSPDYLRLVLALTLLAGIFKLALGVARLGGVVNFVSHSVVTGFMYLTRTLIVQRVTILAPLVNAGSEETGCRLAAVAGVTPRRV